MSRTDRSGRPLNQRQRTAEDRIADPRIRHVVPNGLAPAMPADVLASVLGRSTRPAPAPEPAPEPEPAPALTAGQIRAVNMRSPYRVGCERCGEWTDAPSAKPITHPRCAACGPNRSPRKRKRKPKPQPVPEYELQ